MKTKSNTYGLQQGTVSTICPLYYQQKLNTKSAFVTAESLLQNKKMILKDNKNTCWNCTRITQLFQISVVDLTIKDKDLLPFWNESVEEKSQKLWLPIKTDCVDLALNSLQKFVRFSVQDSWFSMRFHCPQNKNLYKTCLQFLQSSPVEFTASENTVIKSRKIRIYPTKTQEKTLKTWMGAGRYYFNKTVEFLKKPDTKANRFAIQKEILSEVPDWAEKVPYKIKQMAIDDACVAVKNAKKKFFQTHKFQEVHFRRKRDEHDSVYIPKNAVHNDTIFPKLLGKKFKKFSEDVGEVDYDCRLGYEKGKWFLCVPKKFKEQTPISDNQRSKIVALDPGVRTFLTGYTPDFIVEFGKQDFRRLFRLCQNLDVLIGLKAKSKHRYKRAVDNLLFRIDNLKAELHNKIANILVKNFDVIVIPKLDSPRLAASGKLKTKTARMLLGLGHASFLEILKRKASEFNSRVIQVSEAYTSKTCGKCGNIQQISSSKAWKCSRCSSKWDRDFNGARNILLRALVDKPLEIPQEFPCIPRFS